MANPDPSAIAIGDLRWPVTLVLREQKPDPNSAGIVERLVDRQNVMAKIEPVGAQTFYGAMQTDRPITHWITLRWLDWIDQVQAVIRKTTRLDSSTREETFRIRRVREVDGRKRFVLLECQQESRT